jgi:hypothetical protein
MIRLESGFGTGNRCFKIFAVLEPNYNPNSEPDQLIWFNFICYAKTQDNMGINLTLVLKLSMIIWG